MAAAREGHHVDVAGPVLVRPLGGTADEPETDQVITHGVPNAAGQLGEVVDEWFGHVLRGKRTCEATHTHTVPDGAVGTSARGQALSSTEGLASGRTQFTVIPASPSWSANVRVMPARAALDAA